MFEKKPQDICLSNAAVESAVSEYKNSLLLRWIPG